MFEGKPIIGIAGGIGSGKSFIARLFSELGCGVIDSDAQVREVYRQPDVLQTIRSWWGDAVIDAAGQADRRAIATRVFNESAQREKLELLLHPRVDALRQARMKELAIDPKIVAFVWDTPLLFETGLNRRCDAVVFIETTLEERLRRVAGSRGWDTNELQRREKLQWPLDRKRKYQMMFYRIPQTREMPAVKSETFFSEFSHESHRSRHAESSGFQGFSADFLPVKTSGNAMRPRGL